MSRYRKIFNRIFTSIFLVVLLFNSTQSLAADGEALFKANCASCHKPDKDFTGPALKGARDREPSKTWVYDWVHNATTLLQTDAYAKGLYAKYKAQMTAFPNLKNEEIDAILDYVEKWVPPTAPPPPGGGDPANDNSLLFGILTLVLALIAFILLQVNSNLRKLSDEKEGVFRSEPVPVYKNKTYLMAGILLLFAVGGYYTINGAVGLGRMKNYQPKQPIFYSHQVHAGTNQISCLYCHGGAQDSKQASIPSVNTCMNCHKAINKYEGPDNLVEKMEQMLTGLQKFRNYMSMQAGMLACLLSCAPPWQYKQLI